MLFRSRCKTANCNNSSLLESTVSRLPKVRRQPLAASRTGNASVAFAQHVSNARCPASPLSTYSLDSSTSFTIELLSTLIKLWRSSVGCGQQSMSMSMQWPAAGGRLRPLATAANTHAWRDGVGPGCFHAALYRLHDVPGPGPARGEQQCLMSRRNSRMSRRCDRCALPAWRQPSYRQAACGSGCVELPKAPRKLKLVKKTSDPAQALK